MFAAAGSSLWAFLFTASFLNSSPATRAVRAGLHEFVAGKLTAEIIIKARRPCLGLAAVILASTAAHGAEPAAAPFSLHAEGSFPLQYIETVTSASRQHQLSAAPYLGLAARAQLEPDLSTAIFVNGGHGQPGSFRDNDDTFASVGGDIVKRWGAFRTGISLEHTNFFDGTFGQTTSIANDVNFFASYLWLPNPNLKIRPSASATIRLDDAFAVNRYSYNARIDIEQRLFGSWWLVAAPRLRYSDYVGSESGRHDTRLAVLGGLKYDFNDNVSAMMLAGFETRASNIESKNSDKFTVGASIDFNIDFSRPRWPAGR